MKNIHILSIFSAIILLASCNSHENNHHVDSKYTVTSPLVIDTILNQEYVSQIRAKEHIELRALEKGYLQKIYVDEGQLVKKGQLLFQIMPLVYQAEANKAQAETNYAEIEFKTTKNLHDNSIVSANELALSKAKLDKAKAELEMAKVHLGFTEIRAPFDGYVGRLEVRLGSLLDEGELLSSLSNNNKMWVYFNVPESEYLNYKMNSNAKSLPNVKLQLANKMIFNKEGVIETIEADFNNETGTIAFRATFDNPELILRHGETGNVLMPNYYSNAVIIPQSATFEILDKKYVYLLNKSNQVIAKEITVIAEHEHIYIVGSGIKKNDRFLYDGLRKVKNKQKIKFQYLTPQKVFSQLHELHAE